MPTKKTIFIVEDDTALRLALVKQMEKFYTIEQSGDGKEALDWLGKHVPDLILLDIKLPHVDGITILKVVRKNKATKHTPVIIISNIDDQALVAQGLILGAKDYLAKSSYSLEDITEMVRLRMNHS
ncbi:MAG: hypothetical protein A3F54_02055 [Candidatus Kerfeldbacteria bacterium RIFCSPHIGHO2_12_FULL_48_17]|uniref:Response regulatory domain-containing protein n=1 Tax=Candidatus Kerfeldbacteria bacterium RIFCSPHIGHO2_12_FULL_48_17 TaxID=1798542 RepID=A0A1G2AY93_9BACT|nr:MAG: hypothetical protein A3F54_02055 [Candidatus Kerfeldbacteria bacterium RIFCSPHIGHO2_12_FULL_48_17]